MNEELFAYGEITNNIYYELDNYGNFYLGVLDPNGDCEMPDYDGFEGTDAVLWKQNEEVKNNIKKVMINKWITSIGQNSFSGMQNIISFEFEENSQCKYIVGEAITYTKIKNFTLPKKLETVDFFIISSNSDLEWISVQDGNENFQSINGIIFNKPLESSGEPLKLLSFPPSYKENNEFVTYYKCPVSYIASNAFCNCMYLEEFGFAGSSSTNASLNYLVIEEYAFRYCQKLKDMYFTNLPYFINSDSLHPKGLALVNDLTITCMADQVDEWGNGTNTMFNLWVEDLRSNNSYNIQLSVSPYIPGAPPTGKPESVRFVFSKDQYALSESVINYKVYGSWGRDEYEITNRVLFMFYQNDIEVGRSQSGTLTITDKFQIGELKAYAEVEVDNGGNQTVMGSATIVKALAIIQIEIKLKNERYYVNDIFDDSSYNVIALYEDGETIKDITKSSSIIIKDPNGDVFNTGDKFILIGQYNITPLYGNSSQISIISKSFNVTKEYNGIKIVTIPIKTQYEVDNIDEQVKISINGIEIYAYWKTSYYNSNSIYKEKISGGYDYNPKEVGAGLDQKITISYIQEGYNKTLIDAYYIDVRESTITEFKWTQEYDLIDGTRGKMSENAYIPNEYGGLCPVSAKQWNLFIDTLQPFYSFQFTKAESGEKFYALYNQLMLAIKDEYIEQGFKIRNILSYDLFKDLADFLNYKLANAPSPTNE